MLFPVASAPICSLNNIFILSISESITLTESATRYRIISPSVSETITVSETLRQSPIPKTVSETITVSETASLLKFINISLSDTLTVGETIETHGIVSRSVSETITLIETTSKRIDQNVTDTLALTELATYTDDTAHQSISDTIPLMENAVGLKIVTKSITETITIVESAKRVRLIALFDKVNVIESIKVKYVFILQVGEAISIYENPITFSTLKKLQEGISPLETVSYRLVPKCNVSDTIILGETAAKHYLPKISLSDTINLKEDYEIRTIPQSNIVDNLLVTEITKLNQTVHFVFCDCIEIDEHARRVKVLSVSDSVTITERANKNPLSDTIIITEMIVTNILPSCCIGIGYLPNKATTDRLSLTETIHLTRRINKTLSEAIVVNDTVVYLP